MSAPTAPSFPPLSPGEMHQLLSRAGLVLNPGQIADLVLAWRQVAGLIATIPHDRALVDDLAYSFRLPPPAPESAAPAAPRAKAAARKPAAKPPAAKPAKRKSAQRRR